MQPVRNLCSYKNCVSHGCRQEKVRYESSHFKYCPLVWIFHDRGLSNKISRIHKRSLRILHGDIKSSFEELLRKDKSVKIHHKNLQVIATEIYKAIHGLSPQIINNAFEFKCVPYNMRK